MSGTAAMERARAAWGDTMPLWVADLARACDDTSQNKVAARLNRSAALVSQVLLNKYPGDLAAVEEVFKGVFQAAVVTCPALGEMPANECRDWRAKAHRFVSINALRVQMYRACNRCPLHRPDGGQS